MCWITGYKPIKQTAEEDIPVFKIMDYKKDELRSFYMGFKYEIGKLYVGDIEDPKKTRYGGYIQVAFHSYSNKCKIILENAILTITTPDHFNIQSEVLSNRNNRDNVLKVNCIIPKGSSYYINENEEYVSDKIKIISVEKIISIGKI